MVVPLGERVPCSSEGQSSFSNPRFPRIGPLRRRLAGPKSASAHPLEQGALRQADILACEPGATFQWPRGRTAKVRQTSRLESPPDSAHAERFSCFHEQANTHLMKIQTVNA